MRVLDGLFFLGGTKAESIIDSVRQDIGVTKDLWN